MLDNTTLIPSVPADIIIDPTLTMDLTTMNAPGMEGASEMEDEAAAKEETPTTENESIEGDTDKKEAASEQSNMETEAERPPPSGGGPGGDNNDAAVLAGEVKESESEAETIDTEPDRTGGGTEQVAVAAQANEMENIESLEEEASNMTEATNGTVAIPRPPMDNEAEEGAEGETDASSEDKGTTAITPATLLPTAEVPPSPSPMAAAATTESPPTLKPMELIITPSPTIQYVEPSDESLDPVESEQTTEKEAFEDGEVIPLDDDEYMDTEEIPSSKGGDGEPIWEEEDVQKVGGWILFASIILLIYTAYQMSENPDGICARWVVDLCFLCSAPLLLSLS